MAEGISKVKSYKKTTKTGKVVDVKSYVRTEDFADAIIARPGRPGTSAQRGTFPKGRSIPNIEAPGTAVAKLRAKSAKKGAVESLVEKVAKVAEQGDDPTVGKTAAKKAPAKKTLTPEQEKNITFDQPGPKQLLSKKSDEAPKDDAPAEPAKKAAAKAPEPTSDEGSKRPPGAPEKAKSGGKDEREDPNHPEHWKTKFTLESAKKYRDELTKKLTAYIDSKGDTSQQYGIKGKDGKIIEGAYRPERAAMHDEIINTIMEEHAKVPRDKQALMSGGLGGAGKGYVLGKFAGVDTKEYLTIDPDEIKGAMIERGMVPKVEGIDPSEMAWVIHEESSDISKRLQNRALGEGMNIILDNTMGSDKIFDKVQGLKDMGYEFDGVFVDVPIENSINAAFSRHMNGKARKMNGSGTGGRFVPEFLQAESAPIRDKSLNSRNRERFDEIAKMFRHARVYDNSQHGRDPKLITESGAPRKAKQKKMTKVSAEASDLLGLTSVNQSAIVILKRIIEGGE